MNYKIVFPGSGTLATHLSLALKAAGEDIIQIFSRTQEHAQALADKLHCDSCVSISDIRTDADVYIFSVKDDALPNLITQLAVKLSGSLSTGFSSTPLEACPCPFFQKLFTLHSSLFILEFSTLCRPSPRTGT